MRIVGVAFGCLVAALFFGISIAMVYQYGVSRSDTESASQIMAAFGVAAVLYSMGGVTFSEFLRSYKRESLARFALVGVIAAEGVIIFCELGFHGLNIKATELKRAAQSIEVGVSQDQIENSRRVIQELRDVRSSGEINADIALELAATLRNDRGESKPLSVLAAGCADETNPYYAKCAKVLKLRTELARASKFEAAQMRVSTTTAEKLTKQASVNAGAEVGADMTGFSTAGLSHTQLWFMLGFLAMGRLTTVPVIALCLSLRDAAVAEFKVAEPRPIPVAPAPRIETAPLATLIEPDEPMALALPEKKRAAPRRPKTEEPVDIHPDILRRRIEDLIMPGGLLPYPEAAERVCEMLGERVGPKRISALLRTISVGEPFRRGKPAVTYYRVAKRAARALA